MLKDRRRAPHQDCRCSPRICRAETQNSWDRPSWQGPGSPADACASFSAVKAPCTGEPAHDTTSVYAQLRMKPTAASPLPNMHMICACRWDSQQRDSLTLGFAMFAQRYAAANWDIATDCSGLRMLTGFRVSIVADDDRLPCITSALKEAVHSAGEQQESRLYLTLQRQPLAREAAQHPGRCKCCSALSSLPSSTLRTAAFPQFSGDCLTYTCLL